MHDGYRQKTLYKYHGTIAVLHGDLITSIIVHGYCIIMYTVQAYHTKFDVWLLI